MFEIGEYVVFGTDGVCTVENVGSLDIDGVSKDKLYYTLAPVGKVGNNRIFTPVESKRVVLRRIISKDEAHDLIGKFDSIEPLKVMDEKKREETYKAALQSCDCVETVRLIKEIYSRKQARFAAGKKLPSVDERYYNLAVNSLYGELCFPLAVAKNEVKDYILNYIGADKEAVSILE